MDRNSGIVERDDVRVYLQVPLSLQSLLFQLKYKMVVVSHQFYDLTLMVISCH